MYTLIPSKRFKKSIKRISQNGKFRTSSVENVLNILISAQKLPEKYKNHFLSGSLSDFEECHIQADLLLMYKKDKKLKIITLLDIGSHSELFGD